MVRRTKTIATFGAILKDGNSGCGGVVWGGGG